MNIIPVEVTLLNKLLDVVKIYKTEIIFLDIDGRIYGFDEDLSYVVESNITIEIPEYLTIPLIFKTLDFKNFMKEREGFSSTTFNVEYANRYFLSESKYRLMSMVYLYMDLTYLITKARIVVYGISDSPNLRIIDAQTDQQFKEMLKTKASVGTVKLNYSGYKMIINKSFYAINSSDKVTIDIFEDICNTFLARFTIVKKGGIVMTQYIKFLHI